MGPSNILVNVPNLGYFIKDKMPAMRNKIYSPSTCPVPIGTTACAHLPKNGSVVPDVGLWNNNGTQFGAGQTSLELKKEVLLAEKSTVNIMTSYCSVSWVLTTDDGLYLKK